MPKGWRWDETLYQGSAPYYVRGRLPYAVGLADSLADALSLDGDGRLLDVGCGPGVLTLALAHLFAEGIGIDPDAGMLAEAERRASAAGIDHVRWVRARAEDLTMDFGPVRVATFGQSFHWMDRPRVAAIARRLLQPDGAFVHVADVKEPRQTPVILPHPSPPYERIQELAARYLGSTPRAGQGVLRFGTPGNEAAVLREAGFGEPVRLRVPADKILPRSADDVIAWVYSLSSSAPHLFGARRDAFETDLRRLLAEASPTGDFAESVPDTEVFIWRQPWMGGPDRLDRERHE